ncbi:unnamed protein product [Ambrosiozyma monospora]|uniref:Unnamed protein product n=1 Tax=Ambrosiozyma monospora TaxID=43982 RepID=A0A9W7DKF9_AMBMO|nr:unnamed protein product [Ambrosiozyma monospora]
MSSNVKLSKAEYTVEDTYIIDTIKVSTIKFKVPLNHVNLNSFGLNTSSKIDVYIKLINNYKPGSRQPKEFNFHKDIENNSSNLIVFLQGGPGFPTDIPTSRSSPAFLGKLLDKNYTVVLLDQRGTG